MRLTNRLLNTVLFSLLTIAVYAQGVTTSSMIGKILDETGAELIGANVLALHVPSGTTYGNATDVEGFYRIPNMRVGGPYTVTISYTGYEPFTKEGVFLSLGQTFNFSTTMSESATLLEGIEIIATRNDIFDGNKTGQSTVVDLETIDNIPTISRSIGDYARYNPLANISENNDGFTISLAGQNNRYNAIYIDGAINNDVFGLAGSGTNGGQTGVQPISIDAIEQFVIDVAPFDVRQSGFAGGSINAVTRSGTNNLEGSAYYFLRNEDLAGRTPTDNDAVSRTRLPDFSAQTYGARLGGALVKDKVFFFVNYEGQRDNTPEPFQIESYLGEADEATLTSLTNDIREQFGYDVGTYTNNETSLDSDKFLAKIDFNINQSNNVSVRHSYVSSENLEARNSTPGTIAFQNGSEFFNSTTNSTALEWSSLFTSNLSNKLTVGLTFVRDDRDPSGDPFPTVEISDGDNGNIFLGAERFSTANLLNQDIITITNDLTLYKGKHSFLFGANFEFFDAGNLFIRNNFGRYRWFDGDDVTGLDLFLAGEPATQYERSFSQVDNIAGDETAAIADFSTTTFGLYVQDEIQVSNNFKLTAGLRLDIDSWLDDQPINEQFNSTTIPAIEAEGYDLKGAATGQFISTQFRFSPRVGFNWDILGDKSTQLRGGIGIFNSRAPLVWAGGAYNNYGFNIGEGGASNQVFVADVNNQPVRADLNNLTPSGQIDLFADDFKLPQVLKANLAVDRKLGNGFVASFEALYTGTINDVRYQNLNLRQARGNLEGSPDNRPLFLGTQAAFGDDVIDPDYTFIMLASNTGRGYSYNFATTLTKNYTNGFTGTISYSYGDSFKTFEGTSSQNNSQWRGYHPALEIGGFNGGRNDEEGDPQRTTFAQGHRIFGQLSYEIDYLKFGKSGISLNFNGQTGGYFSYVVGARNFLFVDDGGFDNNELFFVPASANEINLVDFERGGQTVTAAEQWTALDAFISDQDGLNDRRGNFAERNSGVIPFEFTTDLRFIQDFYIETGNGKRNTLQITLDIFNFTKLINDEWGRNRFAGSFGNYNIVNLDGNTLGGNTVPSYTVNTQVLDGENPWTGRIDDSGFRSSRWQGQLGLRYIFQ